MEMQAPKTVQDLMRLLSNIPIHKQFNIFLLNVFGIDTSNSGLEDVNVLRLHAHLTRIFRAVFYRKNVKTILRTYMHSKHANAIGRKFYSDYPDGMTIEQIISIYENSAPSAPSSQM
jgi:hypothetical protein